MSFKDKLTFRFQKLLGREEGTENFVPLDKDETRLIDILYNTVNMRSNYISKAALYEVVPTFVEPSQINNSGGIK